VNGVFETLAVSSAKSVVFADIAAPPMNLLGPELVGDLVSLIERAEADEAVKVLVFRSADPEYFISHVDTGKRRPGSPAKRLSPSCSATSARA
jgi:enoyl-CoA hydratase/carnithine racemase